MTISHPSATNNAATDAVVDLVDQGTTDAQGDLVIFAGATELARINLQDPAFGNSGATNAGEAELQGTPLSATAGNSGTADGFEVQDKDNGTVFSGLAEQKYAITGVTTGSDGSGQFQVDTDLTSVLSAGDIIRVAGSTGNDGKYTVVSVSFASPTSTITVVENVGDATADGNLHPGDCTLDNTSINSGQTVQVDSLVYDAMRQ